MAAVAGSPPATAGSAPSPAVAPPPGNPRFPLFDGLRAVAAISVLTFHAGYWSKMDLGTGGIAPYVARLNVGVPIFFVISGFLLYRPFLAARTGDGPAIRLRDYARRRVLRIVPAYWVALTLLGIYPGLNDLWTHDWWKYYFFAQDYGRWTPLGGLDVAWSLGCEVAYYVLLPVFAAWFAWLAGRAGRRIWWTAEVAVLAALMLGSTAYHVYAYNRPYGHIPQAAFPGSFSWFAAGMLLAYTSLAVERHGGRVRDLAGRYAWIGFPLGIAAYVLLCRGLGLYSGNPFQEHDSDFQDVALYMLDGITALALALPCAFERRPRSAVGRVLGGRTLAWLGLISYGIYLWHNRLLTWLVSRHQAAHQSWGRFLYMEVACLALAIVAGALSYYIVERPFLRLKENPLARWRRPPAPVVACAPAPAVEEAAPEVLKR